MLKRLSVVLCLTLLLLVLVSAATTIAAPQAGNFGQIEKPGWGAAINPTSVARYAVDGRAVTVQRLASLRSRQPIGIVAVGSQRIISTNLMHNCANTAYRYFNAQLQANLLYPIGLQYEPNTITNINSLTPTYVYTPLATTWPATYSPTFDYHPPAISCGGVEGIMLPYTNPETVLWSFMYP